MQTWKWLYDPASPYRWRFMISVLVRAALLFVLFNLVFALVDPLPTLGRLSAYNTLFRGRERLPYGENPAASFNLSLFQLDAMLASHALAGAGDDEYRVLVIGDSSVWGILLRPSETLAGQINALELTVDNRPVRAYNLGYPTMSLVKDLMLLDYALRTDPDLIVWAFTLESFAPDVQLESAIVRHNAEPVRDLIRRYDLDLNPDDPRFETLTFWERTIVGQRRALADLLRLQFYGVAWAITGTDQEYPADYTPAQVDLAGDESWHGYDAPQPLTADDLALDVLHAGVARAGETPILLVNEPILISDGENSDIRYNFFYPRWAYDAYRDLLHEQAEHAGWRLLDLWDALPDPACYTDSAVHLTPACSARLARRVGAAIVQTTPGESHGG